MIRPDLSLSELGRRTSPPAISWLMSMTLGKPELISLAAGFTDSETLPVKEVRRLLGKVLTNGGGQAALQYGSTMGLPELRTLTAARVQALDGITGRQLDPEQTVITSGSQQFLYIVTEALCSPGDLVIVEDPTYFVFLGILQSHGIQARGVKMERDGVCISELRRLLEQLKDSRMLGKLKLLYVVSYYQNPTGISTCLAKKAAILGLLKEFEPAAGHPLYLVEDAAYRELAFKGTPEASALTLSNNRVIYAGTYSKPFSTGVRVGFGILPQGLLQPVLSIKGNHDFGSASLLQHLLAEALRSGAYEAHLRALRKRYAEKARTAVEALEQYGQGRLDWLQPDGGLYVWAWPNQKHSTGRKSRFFREALRRGVLYVPGEFCYADDPLRPKPRHELRLSFGAASLQEIREGIRRLAAVAELGKRGAGGKEPPA